VAGQLRLQVFRPVSIGHGLQPQQREQRPLPGSIGKVRPIGRRSPHPDLQPLVRRQRRHLLHQTAFAAAGCSVQQDHLRLTRSQLLQRGNQLLQLRLPAHQGQFRYRCAGKELADPARHKRRNWLPLTLKGTWGSPLAGDPPLHGHKASRVRSQPDFPRLAGAHQPVGQVDLIPHHGILAPFTGAHITGKDEAGVDP